MGGGGGNVGEVFYSAHSVSTMMIDRCRSIGRDGGCIPHRHTPFLQVKNTATSLLNLIFGKNQSKTITANRVLFKGILFWKYFIALCLANCCNKRRFVDSKCLQRSPDPLAGFNVSFLHLFLFFFPHRSHVFFTLFVFVMCPRSLWHYAILISSFNNNNNNGLREWHGRDKMGGERRVHPPAANSLIRHCWLMWVCGSCLVQTCCDWLFR